MNKILCKKNVLCFAFLGSILYLKPAIGAECSDRNAIEAAMSASSSLMGGDSFRKPRVLKRHHPSKRKEVATYFRSGDLYYSLFWLVSDNCKAGFIKRTQGKY